MSKDEEFLELYRITARVKNLARGSDAHLTPMGESLCNLYVHVLKDLYDFAEILSGKNKRMLVEIIQSHEDMPRKIILLGKKR